MLHDKSLLSASKTDSRFSRLFDLFEQGLPQAPAAEPEVLCAQKSKHLLDLARHSLDNRPAVGRSATKPCRDDEFFRRIRAAGGGFDMGDLGEPLL